MTNFLMSNNKYLIVILAWEKIQHVIACTNTKYQNYRSFSPGDQTSLEQGPLNEVEEMD